MTERAKKQDRRENKLKLPVPFEEAVADILKVKPPPDKKRRGQKKKRKPATKEYPMPKFQPGDKVWVSNENGTPKAGVIISHAGEGSEPPAAFIEGREDIPKPSVPHYLVRLDDGMEEVIREQQLESR